MNNRHIYKSVVSFLAFILIAMPKSSLAIPKDTSTTNQIPIASIVKGKVANSIIWTENSLPPETRATITLTEPLKYSDGSIALPKNSSLIVEVSDWDDAGFVTLRPIAVVTEGDGEFTQRAIPENALLIRNEDNQPLTFKTRNSGNNNSFIDNVVNEAIQTGSRRLPFGSVVSKTIRDNSRRARRANRGEIYSVEEDTEVSIYVNSFLSIED
jgi:uncharacterized lipoprotein YbaY